MSNRPNRRRRRRSIADATVTDEDGRLRRDVALTADAHSKETIRRLLELPPGTRLPGGCRFCAATQTVERDNERGGSTLHTWHETGCEWKPPTGHRDELPPAQNPDEALARELAYCEAACKDGHRHAGLHDIADCDCCRAEQVRHATYGPDTFVLTFYGDANDLDATPYRCNQCPDLHFRGALRALSVVAAWQRDPFVAVSISIAVGANAGPGTSVQAEYVSRDRIERAGLPFCELLTGPAATAALDALELDH